MSPLSTRIDLGDFDDEFEAVAAAVATFGPNITQVTFETIDRRLPFGTFAVRHLTWRDGEVRDSGWRAWVANRFVRASTLDDLVPAVRPQWGRPVGQL